MVPWRNSWFQIAFFAWIVSGALLIVDYAPKIPVSSAWMQAFERTPRQPSEAPPKPSPPSEQQSPEKPAKPIEDQSATKGPTPARPAPVPYPAKPAAKTPNASGTNAGSAELALGNAAYDSKDYARAAPLYDRACKGSIASACDRLGSMYDTGEGVVQDYSQARALFSKACDGGDAGACISGGGLYSGSLGGARDPSQAAVLYSKGCDGGTARANAIACGRLGNLYLMGYGVAKDPDKAKQLITRACKMGDQSRCDPTSPEKQTTKALDALDSKDGSAELSQGMSAYLRQDYAQAMQWYQKAAAKDNSEAEYQIGTLYLVGSGVPRDNAEALHWFQKAGAQGNLAAERLLGVFYETGQGTPKDVVEAIKWYQKVAAQGDAQAKQKVAELQAAQNSR
jgi:uncharacterized protein